MNTGNPFDNPEFRAEFSNTLDKKLEPLVRLVSEDHALVEKHEAALQRGRGAAIVLGGLWGILEAVLHNVGGLFGSSKH
jgi:hypothetical protein